MTPEQRATDVVESMGNEASMPHLWHIIMKAITTAVAEEREACARIADKYGATALKNAPPEPARIAREIRARNGGEK